VRIKIVVATGLALTAIAVLATLLHAPETVVAANGMPSNTEIATAAEAVGVCQRGETLLSGTSAIRLQIEATTGPRIDLEVLENGLIVTRGTLGTGWYGSVATVPVPPLEHTVQRATICFRLTELTGWVVMQGGKTKQAIAATSSGKPLPGRLRITYLRPSHTSWWSLAGTVIQHLSLGRAASGTWIVIPIAALASAAIVLGAWLLVRELE
jgi:hypothetical protein